MHTTARRSLSSEKQKSDVVYLSTIENSKIDEMEDADTELIVWADEARRGCAFSRVYVAVVMIPDEALLMNRPSDIIIRDSKLMSEKQRRNAARWIKKNMIYRIGWEEAEVVDELNVTQAAMRAFHRCLDSLDRPFSLIVMDGTYFKPYVSPDRKPVQSVCIPKADSLHVGVSCASILAKDAGDRYVYHLCDCYPELVLRYDIASNKGYPAPQHKQGLKKYGITQFHRKTYECCRGLKFNPICSVLIHE